MIPREFDFKTYRELKEEIVSMLEINDIVGKSIAEVSVMMTLYTLVDEGIVLKWDRLDFFYKGDSSEYFVNAEVPTEGICKRLKKSSNGDFHLELQTKTFYHKDSPSEPLNRIEITFSKYYRYEPNIPYKAISEQ